MKAHPPKVKDNSVLVFSPFVGRFIENTNWGTPAEAQEDLKAWQEAHRETLARMKAKLGKE